MSTCVFKCYGIFNAFMYLNKSVFIYPKKRVTSKTRGWTWLYYVISTIAFFAVFSYRGAYTKAEYALQCVQNDVMMLKAEYFGSFRE